MKRFLQLGLLVVALLSGLVATAAVKTTIKWETPGSIILRVGNMNSEPVELAADQTEYVAESTAAYVRLYILPADGFILTGYEGVQANGNPYSAAYAPTEYNKHLSITANAPWNDCTININCYKNVREDKFDIDVVNGAEYITATFANSNYSLELVDGNRSFDFNPAFDKKLQIAPIKGGAVSDIYSVKLNGEEVTDITPAGYFNSKTWNIPVVNPGDKISIQVAEGEIEKNESSLTLEYANEMENCLLNIYNKTTGKFIVPEDIENNTITVAKGTSLNVNFKTDDYTYTGFYFNGTSVSLNGSKLELTLTEESNTLKVEGTAKAYGQVRFQGYIMNPEGVNLHMGEYQGDDIADLSEGTAVASDTKVPSTGYMMPAASTKKFDLQVSAKTPRIFVSPKEGWYIEEVVARDSDGWGLQSSLEGAEGSTTTFYIVALPYKNDARINVNVIGDKTVRLTGNAILSNWENPTPSFSLKEGEQTVDFVAGFSNPFSLRVLGTNISDVFQVWLDGAALAADDNGIYSVDPYIGELGTSTLTVYADGQKLASPVAVSVTKPSGVNAKLTYSEFNHVVSGTPINLLRGTKVNLTVENADGMTVTANDTPVTAVDGVYSFVAEGAKLEIVIAEPAKEIDIMEIDPVSGTQMKSLSTIKVVVPIIDEMMEKMMYTDMDAIAKITLSDGTNTYHPAELGEIETKYDSNWEAVGQIFPIIFTEPVTAAGTYTLTIPAGTFYEVAYNDAFESFDPVDNGITTNELTAEYSIDPNTKTPIENYTLTPASGTVVSSIDVIRIAFNEFTLMQGYMGFTFPESVTLSNGTKEVICGVGLDDENSEEALTFMIVPFDEEWNQVEVTEPGEWTLTIPEGAFGFQGDNIPAFTATYTIAKANAYELTPAPGDLVAGGMSKFTITFPSATKVTYNDNPVSLVGPEELDITSADVLGTAANRYEILFLASNWAEGEYTMTIPAGTFTIDDKDNEEIVAKYNFKANYVLTPASGTELNEITEFIIEFPAAKEVEFVGSTASVILIQGGKFATGLETTEVTEATVPTFKFTLQSEVDAVPLGNLTLQIQEESFLIDGTYSDQISANYTYNKAVSFDYQVDPYTEEMVIGEYGINFAFIFGEEYEVRSTTDAKSKIAVTLDGEPITDYECMVESNMILFGIYNPAELHSGKLEVKIEEGAYTLSGSPIPAISHSWQLVEPKTYTMVITPSNDETVSDLSKITISFPEAKTAELWSVGMISFRMKGSYEVFNKTVNEVEDAECPTFEIVFDKVPTEKGEYQLTMAEGAFFLDNAQSSAAVDMIYTFDKSAGIGSIGIDANGKVTVVSIDGKVLFNNVDAEVLNTLEDGLYIVNGKKLFIRK